MSAIFAYLIRTTKKRSVVYVPKNGIVGCFSTLLMIEINILRLSFQKPKRGSLEINLFNKKLKNFNHKLDKSKKFASNLDFIIENPSIETFPVEIRTVKENEEYTSEKNDFDIQLSPKIYDAEDIYEK